MFARMAGVLRRVDRAIVRTCDSSLVSSKLVDSARSHMLVSKIKPCMCKFTLINSKTADGSLQQY